MEERRKYYEAYEDRYRQVHRENLQWFSGTQSNIVPEIIEKYKVGKTAKILEIGCGEGRDARFLLRNGFDVLATDIAPTAIAYCKKKDPAHADRYSCLDCLGERFEAKFDYIYAVAVVHMLVPDEDRDRFYRFYRDQLTDRGIGLICSMGDGSRQLQSDITNAFEIRDRVHEPTGRVLRLANTSCRMVSEAVFKEEILRNGLTIREMGTTSVEPDFPEMMYAVVSR